MKAGIKAGWGLCLLSITWLSVLGMTGPDERQSVSQVNQSAINIPELLHFQVQRLDFSQPQGDNLITNISLDGTDVALALQPRPLRADNFQLLIQDEEGQFRRIAPPPSRTYRGQVEGIAGSRVSASLVDGELSAVIVLPDGPTWAIQPLSQFEPGAAKGNHLVYRSDDVVPLRDYRCGTDESAAPSIEPSPQAARAADTGLLVAEIAIDVDSEFFQKRGRRAENVARDIEAVMNGVETIYEKQAGITYEITAIVIRTPESDPYSATDAGGLLSQLRREWTRNSSLREIPRDVTHLMTGRNLDGNVIGVALLRTLCNPFNGFGLSQSLFTSSLGQRVCLTAHELGHNWNAVHCDGDRDCGIMCATINRCSRDCANFGARAIAAITEFRDISPCFDQLADPIDPPFVDGFSAQELDTAKWVFINGAEVNDSALGEPSEPNALNLSARGPGQFQDDEIRSNVMLLRRADAVTISFFTQHRGVESGEALVVEYFARSRFGALQWKELDRITSNGIDQDSFVPHSFRLIRSNRDQSDAFHDGFRIRFRSEVDQVDDNWYIDDVEVAADP